jgi:hypothetical protein
MKPPMFEPVLSTPHAAPTSSPPASMVATQKGPSEAEARPNDSASNAPTTNEPETWVPRNSKSALRRMHPPEPSVFQFSFRRF